MSLPKEPRQLMINIMYLVLTALLALNVSAEIFNAFKVVDKGLKKSNVALDQGNNALPAKIIDGAKKKASLQVYADRIEPGRKLSKDLNNYIESIISDLTKSGKVMKDGKETDEWVDKKDYAYVTKLMDEEGKGEELKAKLLQYKKDILKFVDEDDQADFARNIAVAIDDESWKEKGKTSWSHMNFSHMPLQAVLPLFTKWQNDVKSTEASYLNYLANKVGTTTDVVIDKYAVVSAPEKSYIIKGEKYKAEIFLTAAASADSKTGISVAVNGKKLPTNADGIGVFEATPGSVGVKRYTATASISNPVTGETKSFKKEFTYEVGERSMTVSASKMNVFYIGVDNPIEVSAAGVTSNDIKVSMGGAGGASVKKSGDGYVVRATKPTKKGEFAKVNVSAPGMNAYKDFRVKRIPDPVPMLGKNRGGSMGNGEIKIYKGLRADLSGFDFDAKCEIVGYNLLYAAKRQDIQRVLNPGQNFNADAKRLIGKASPGDKFLFDNIKCKCPGDIAARPLGQMIVSIK